MNRNAQHKDNASMKSEKSTGTLVKVCMSRDQKTQKRAAQRLCTHEEREEHMHPRRGVYEQRQKNTETRSTETVQARRVRRAQAPPS